MGMEDTAMFSNLLWAFSKCFWATAIYEQKARQAVTFEKKNSQALFMT